jgi:hypothetical protein
VTDAEYVLVSVGHAPMYRVSVVRVRELLRQRQGERDDDKLSTLTGIAEEADVSRRSVARFLGVGGQRVTVDLVTAQAILSALGGRLEDIAETIEEE